MAEAEGQRIEVDDSLEALLDEIQSLSDRKDDQRSAANGSHVYLNIYDMIGLNHYISYLGLGAFHTGVEVYGVEYAYGGHPYSYTGIYSMEPKQVEAISTDGGVKFKESLKIGYTTMTEAEVAELIHSLGSKYNGNTYHVFHKNCNHFSEYLCEKLCGKSIPHWINRLAYMSSWMPFVIRCLPPSWVNPGNPTGQGRAGATGLVCSPYSKSQSHGQFVAENLILASLLKYKEGVLALLCSP